MCIRDSTVRGQRADRAQPEPGGDRRAELQRQPLPLVHGHRAGAASEGDELEDRCVAFVVLL